MYLNVIVESPGSESNMQLLRIMVSSQFLNIHTGGAERYIGEVCKRLVKDYELDVAYLSSDIADADILSPPCLHFMTTS